MKFLFRVVLIIGLVSARERGWAQGEHNNWLFGFQAGLRFAAGQPPTPLANPAFSLETSAVLSDSVGQLLCFSNGQAVFNRQRAPMPNGGAGLNPSDSGTQGALLVRQPGSANRVYLFTVDAVENQLADGLRYSVIDLSLRGGLGDVLPGEKYAPVAPGGPVAEKLTAVRHANGRDYWIIVHEWGTNAFRCYQLSAGGLAAAPVRSAVGLVHQGGTTTITASDNGYRYGNAIGWMRVSPDGRWLAVAAGELGLELFAFDNLTGRVAAPRRPAVPHTTTRPTFYGLEFSPDNTRLYVTMVVYEEQRSVLYQLDLADLGTAVGLWVVPTPLEFGALAGGPDGRIYVAQNGAADLSVIATPNEEALFCNLQRHAVPLAAPARLGYGLPNLAPRQLPTRLQLSSQFQSQSCAGTWQQFGSRLGPALADSTLRWDFGDPASGAANSATGPAPTHFYATPGRYLVTLTASAADGQRYSVREELEITQANCPVELPNIITPNGDAANQTFVLHGLPAADWALTIYNRWGREVYQRAHYDNAWAAEGLADGVYYYLLTNPRTGQHYKGWVEVAR